MNSLTAADLLRLATDDAAGRRGKCLDEVTLAGFADAGLDVAGRAAAMSHLASCGHCRRQLAALASLLGDSGISAEVARTRGAVRTGVRPMHVALGMAAVAAAILLVVAPRDTGVDLGTHRDPTITASAAPAAFAPVGVVHEARELIWGRVDGASSYRVTLFDSTGSVLFEAQLGDTTATIPDSVDLVAQRAYLWKVEARTGWDRWSSSELVEFQINSAGTPEATGPIRVPRIVPANFTSAPPDSLRLVASRVTHAALVREIQARPLDVREALRDALARAVRGDSANRGAELAMARRLAAAYETAWHDPFLTREVARFTAWSSARRAVKVSVDSARIAGNAAFGRDGPGAAIDVWRRAMGRAVAIPDSAGVAGLLGNIGAAMAREDRLDSAVVYLTRARSLAEVVGDLRVQGNAISELAGVSEQRNDVEGARTLYARAIELRHRIGDSRGLAADYNNIASVARAVGDVDQARQHLEAALAINRRDNRRAATATNLVNLAALAASAGAFGRADDDYREALVLWRATGDSAEAASAMVGLGELNLRRGDYAAAARNFSEAVIVLDRTGPVADAVTARQRLAAALAAQGQLQGALDHLRRAQQIAELAHVSPQVRAGAALMQADIAMQLNQYVDAGTQYTVAHSLYRRATDQGGIAAAQHGQGLLHLAQGNTVRASEMLAAALRTQLAAHDGRGAAITRAALGGVAAQSGDSSLARRYLERATAELDRLGDPVASAAVFEQRAALEASSGRPAAAEALYRVALTRLGNRVAPEVGWRVHAGLAAVRAAQGATDEAAREFRASIAEIDRIGASLHLAERRSALRADKWDVYVQLATLERNRGRIAASFAVSEQLRAREMTELLANGRVAVPRDTARQLVEKEQDLRRRIGELTLALERNAPDSRLLRGPDVSGADGVSREALLQAQAAYTSVQLEIRERAPRHAALVSPRAVTWSDVAQRLGADEAMIEYLLGDTGSIAYVITRDTLVAIDLVATRHDIARRVEFVRGTLQPRRSARLDSLWRAPLRQLHRDLVAPIEASGVLAGKRRLTIIPHAELHYLPFAALIETGGPARFLVERYHISMTPSASVWSALGARTGRRTGTGTLALAPRLEQLPASRGEVATIAQLGGSGVRVLSGATATEAAFRRDAPTRRVVHLATYGVLNKQNPLFSFVELAPDRQHDGRLEVHEVFGLRLVADLVVLSACQTALASGALTDVPAGDDWIGLSRAFLTAGAKHVMASLWPVEDRATATLMDHFYRRYTAHVDPARTLAAAQRAMLAVPATAHPYYWAGFEVIGGR